MSIGTTLDVSGMKFKVRARTMKQMDKISGGKYIGQIDLNKMAIDISCEQHVDMAIVTLVHEFWHIPEKLLSDFPKLTEDQLDVIALMTLSLFDQLPELKQYFEKHCTKMGFPR